MRHLFNPEIIKNAAKNCKNLQNSELRICQLSVLCHLTDCLCDVEANSLLHGLHLANAVELLDLLATNLWII